MNRVLASLLCVLAIAPCPTWADGLSGWWSQVQSVVSSLKVNAAQNAASGDKTASATRDAAQAGASSAIDLHNREVMRQVWEDYGPSGQLTDPCYQVGMAKTAAAVTQRTSASADKAAALVYAMSDDGAVNAGGLSGFFGGMDQRSAFPFAASVAVRAERHRQKYCSVSESSTGLCTLSPNGMQSGDSDFSVHLAPGKTFGWDQTEAASDFVKTVAPRKTAPLPRGCTTPECLSAFSAQRSNEVYMSMARYSFLRFVEAHSTQASGDAKQAANP